MSMKDWLRRVVPDLFLAAVVALLVTLAIQHLENGEVERIQREAQVAADEGLTLDERIEVVGNSIRRSTVFHLPLIVAVAGISVGLVCQNRRWAWLTAFGAILPALLMGAAFFIDRPFPAGILATFYTALAISMAIATCTLRRRWLPIRIIDRD